MKIKNLRDSEEFNVLADLIREINPSGDQLIFSPSAGNWGDGLINYGTRQFLNAHHFSWKEINKKDNAKAFTESSFKDRIVLMGGGGSWSNNGNRAKKITTEVSQSAKFVVVLPTTFALPRVDSKNVFYFARDQYSSLDSIPEAFFCHDMAFFTELDLYPTESKIWRIFAMRDDNEGHGYGENFPQNIDLSRLGDGDYRFVDPLFNILNNFKVVSTDRMHVAIAAAMLGAQVNLIPGNYAKSADVFKSSLSPNFPNVKLREFEDVLNWYKGL